LHQTQFRSLTNECVLEALAGVLDVADTACETCPMSSDTRLNQPPAAELTSAASPVNVDPPSPDERTLIAEFIAFLKEASAKRHPTGPMLRFNQGRQTACVEAEFIVRDDLEPELRVGLFAQPRTYKAAIRFANAVSQSDREKDVRGMAIKISGVQGRNLTLGATTQDFVLNSHPVMVVGSARAFLQFLRAMEAGGPRRLVYLLSHPRSLRIALRARGHPSSHLDIPYWSTTPYLFGEGRAVKYKVAPSSAIPGPRPRELSDAYLRDAVRAHLARSDATFDFMVQFQTDARRMPIEDASVEWSEHESPGRPVARIRIPRQDIDRAGRAAVCEDAAYNPWHSIAEHRPLGSFNRVRREIYQALAEFRAQRRSARDS
jgi:hypothetical protein